MALQAIDPNRHYASLQGGPQAARGPRIKVACGSGADISVSKIQSCFIEELEDGAIADRAKGGPLFIECSKHGHYLGFIQPLPKGQADDTGKTPLALPMLLFPLRDPEYILPIGTE